MKTKNMWIPVLSGAVLTTLVSNLPFIGLVNCLLFAGFWGSAILAVWLYRRLKGSMTFGEGVIIGALTGVFSGALGFTLSFFGLAGLQGLLNTSAQYLPADAIGSMGEIAIAEALAFNSVGILFNIMFGTVGGIIGGVLFRTDRQYAKAWGRQMSNQ